MPDLPTNQNVHLRIDPCQGYPFLWTCWKQLWSLFNVTEPRRILTAEAETPCLVNSNSVFHHKADRSVLYLYFWSYHSCIPGFSVAQLEERAGKCSSSLPCSPDEGRCDFKIPDDGSTNQSNISMVKGRIIVPIQGQLSLVFLIFEKKKKSDPILPSKMDISVLLYHLSCVFWSGLLYIYYCDLSI